MLRTEELRYAFHTRVGEMFFHADEIYVRLEDNDEDNLQVKRIGSIDKGVIQLLESPRHTTFNPYAAVVVVRMS